VHHIAFRLDASNLIGTGHFMRCMTLAVALKKRGAEVLFVCRHLPDYLHGMLVEHEIELALLNTTKTESVTDDLTHAHWLGVSQQLDAEETIQVLLSDRTWDWLVVDHYALDICWEERLRKTVNKIIVIDDIADRQHDCDLLLDQNYHVDMNGRYEGKVTSQCQLLLGPMYALLRVDFQILHKSAKLRSGPVNRILVFFGGVDASNFTGTSIEALSEIEIPGLHVDVVIGANHPYLNKIKEACESKGFVCYVQTDKMAELMAAADLAIGAGGSATWERCSLGLPSLTVALADNQVEIAKGLDVFGACVFIGTLKSVNAVDIQREITLLVNSPHQIRELSEKSFSITDGMGVNRICREMGC